MAEPKTLPNHNLLYESENLCIYYNFANDWLYINWIGEHNLESIKEGSKKILQCLKAERTHKILNDNTHALNIWSDAAKWIATEFSFQLEAAGLEYVAWVYSPDYYCRLSADKVMESHISSIVTITFDNIRNAEDWLRSV